MMTDDNQLAGDMEENTELRVLGNGAMLDPKTGKIVKGAPLSSSQARALANKRWRTAQAAALSGLRELSPTTPSAFEAWKALVKQQYLLALDIERGRASTDAAKFVGQAAGLLRDRREIEQDDSRTSVLSDLGAAVARQIIDRLERG